MQLNLSNIFIWKYFYKTIMYVLHNWAMLLQSFQGKREETVEEGGQGLQSCTSSSEDGSI